MRRKWRKLDMLSWPERWLLLRVMLLFPWIELSLRLRGVRWTQARLSRYIASTPIQDGLSPEVVSRVVRWAAGPVRATCLRQSLVLWWLLKRRGVGCAIKIGAVNTEADFKAHAWVEWEGGGQSDSPETLKHLAVFEHRAKTGT